MERRGARPARPQLRDRRRGRLDPHRRGPDAAHHQRPGRPDQNGTSSSPRIAQRLQRATDGSRRLRGRREASARVAVIEAGVEKVEDQLGIDNLYESVNTPLVGYLNNALKAKELYKRDKDYVVIDGEVLIVDEFTGRILHGRRYNEGMHQAIEAKEGVEIKQENQTLATITLQNYFRLYEKLAGMTGTADDRGRGVRPDLQARRRADPDQPADGPHRPARPRLQDRGGEVRRRSSTTSPSGTRRASRSWSAPRASRSRELLSQLLLRARRPARGAQREAPRAGGADRRAGRPQGRGHRRHQHGRPRHRHHARRQPRVHRRGRAAPARPVDPVETPEEYEAAWPRRAGARPRRRSRPSTRRSSSSAVCTCSAPSGTSRAGSTTSCAAAPAGRATRASPGSTCRSATT